MAIRDEEVDGMGRKSGEAGPGKGHPRGSSQMSTALLRALDHSLRREVLRIMHSTGQPQSAKGLSGSIDAPGTTISYHLKVLASLNVISLVAEKPVRAVLEKCFASDVADHEQAVLILSDTERCDEAVRLHK